MRTAISHTTIVTADAGRTVHHDATLVVEDDRIVAIDPTNRAADRPGTDVIDGRGKALFPGLSNCHTHLHLTHSRGIQEDFGFPSALRFPSTVAAFLSGEELAVFAALGAIEAIRSGTTGLIEIGFDVPAYAAALVPSGLRLVLAQSTSDVVANAVASSAMFSPARADASLQRVADLIERWHGAEGGRVTCCVAAHAPEACSSDLLRAARTLAEARRLRYTIHLNQSRWEVEQVMSRRGVRPTEYLSQSDFLGPELIAAHCRFMAPSEVALLGQSRAFVSHNAAMAARRAAAPPIQALAAAGCTIALGSDNMAEDMVEVMRAALFMERVIRQDAQSPQPEDVLAWAANNGARALGHGEIAGSLEVGRKADLFVVNARRPNLVPTVRIISAFVHNGQPADIEAVMVNGRWLMREGKVLTLDEKDIVERAETIGQRAWRQLIEKYPDVPFPIRLPHSKAGGPRGGAA
ncbi:MAG: amidohydrolase family protein [Candidatus Rokuibacteriota bacterium]